MFRLGFLLRVLGLRFGIGLAIRCTSSKDSMNVELGELTVILICLMLGGRALRLEVLLRTD